MRSSRLALLLALAVLIAACTGAEPELEPGAVTDMLGPPDRVAHLRGKVLEDVDPDEVNFAKERVVFVYQGNDVRVWFADGVVDQITRSGQPVDPVELGLGG
jgi:hypothetical protein